MSDGKITVKIIENGPARVQCEHAEILMPDGSTVTKEGLVVICRCGASEQKPFCDGSHKACGFKG